MIERYRKLLDYQTRWLNSCLKDRYVHPSVAHIWKAKGIIHAVNVQHMRDTITTIRALRTAIKQLEEEQCNV